MKVPGWGSRLLFTVMYATITEACVPPGCSTVLAATAEEGDPVANGDQPPRGKDFRGNRGTGHALWITGSMTKVVTWTAAMFQLSAAA